MKKLIKSNPFLFSLWYHFYRKHRGVKINYFNSETKFLIDGYPRSGNTFAVSLTKNIFNEKNFLHHFHAIAPIKISLNKDIPVFILIREPKEAITSNYLKTFALKNESIPSSINKLLLKRLTLEYLNFYRFVLKKKKEIRIIDFYDLINIPEKVISLFNELVYDNKIEVTSTQIKNAVNSYRGATDTFGSSKPNPEKEKYKDELKMYLYSSKEYKKALKLYNILQEHCEK